MSYRNRMQTCSVLANTTCIKRVLFQRIGVHGETTRCWKIEIYCFVGTYIINKTTNYKIPPTVQEYMGFHVLSCYDVISL